MASDIPTCPKCGRKMVVVLSPKGKGPRPFQCKACDAADPMKSASVEGWVKGSLRPPV